MYKIYCLLVYISRSNMAMDSDLEELQLQMEKQLCEVTKEVLVQLAVFFKWEEEKYRGKSRLSIARLLRREIEEQVAQIQDENECRSFIERIREQLLQKDDHQAPPADTIAANKEFDALKQQLDDLTKEHQKQVEALQSKMEETELKTSTTVSKSTAVDLKQVLRREVKIIGQIGPGTRSTR